MKTQLPTEATTETLSRWRRPVRAWVLVAVALGTFMTYLDNNVAIPTIQRSFHLSQSGIEWVVSAYILFFAGLLLAGGRLADHFGRRRLFVIGLGIFTAASLLAGLSGGADVLIIARGLQGLGAALLTPATLALLTSTYPERDEQARAIGIWGAVGALALAFGPVIGGVLTQHASWHWIFFLNVPMGLVTLGLAAWAIPADHPDAPRHLDVGGIVTSALALFALTYALIQGTHDGWTSPVILGCFALALLGTALFVKVERRGADPMVDFSLFATRSFSAGTVVEMLWAFGLFGIYFFTAIYLQSVLGFSATKAGLAFVPMALLMAVGATVSDRVVARVGAHRVIAVAMVTMAAGIIGACFCGGHATFGEIMIPFALIGIGGGFTIPLTHVVVSGLPKERAGIASGVFNASREVAGLLGITVIGVVLSARQNVALRQGQSPITAFLDGYRLGLLVAGALVALGGVTAFLSLPRGSAAEAPVHADELVEVC